MSAYSALIQAESSLSNYWELGDSPGSSTAADSKGSATLAASSVTFGAAPLISTGTAASLGGTGTLTSASSPISSVNNTSYEAWFQWTPGATVEQCILKIGSVSSKGIGLVINGNATTAHHLYILAEGNSWNDTGYVVDGNVHHLVVTISGTNTSNTTLVYVDGSLVKTFTTISYNQPASGMGIGCESDGSRKFNGVVDEAAVYTAVLTASAIAGHWIAGYPNRNHYGYSSFIGAPKRPALQARWRRGLVMGHIANGYGKLKDIVAANDGTPTNGAAWGTGCFGDEIELGSASNTYVGFPAGASAGITGGSAFTVSVLASYAASGLGTIPTGSDRFVVGRMQSTPDFFVSLDNAGARIRANVNATGGTVEADAPKPETLDYVLYTLRFNAGTVDLFFGGQKVATASGGGSTVANNSPNAYGLGNDLGTSSRAWIGAVKAHYLWSYALSDRQVAALAADPFAPGRPPRQSPLILLSANPVIRSYAAAIMPAA